jgi:hypothetical protein
MPTGYTALLCDKPDTTLNAFVWRCARGFGALIMMRDEPTDAPIPRKFVPSDWSEKRLTEAKQELRRFETMTPADATAEAEQTYRRELRSYEEDTARTAAQRARYEAMLKAVKAWRPPTPEHEGLQSFMAEQLRESIRFDCGHEREPPVKLDGPAHLKRLLSKAQWDVEYHTKHHAEELARTDQRNAWVSALRESVGPPPQGEP